MDYEKKYKEAFEIAKEVYHDHRKDRYWRDWLTKLFPELKEDNDERIRKAIHIYLDWLDGRKDYAPKGVYSIKDMIAWLEKQGDKIVDCQQNHQDVKHPNGGITMEDFNGGEGFYKLHLDYLSKKQVEEVEEMVRMWNKESKTSNENIKTCVEMCLTDANEQRFEDFGTSLKDCLAWLEKQGEKDKPKTWCAEDEQNLNVVLCFIPDEYLRRWLKDKLSYDLNNKLDADKVIEWLQNHLPNVTCYGYTLIEQFKKDFGL